MAYRELSMVNRIVSRVYRYISSYFMHKQHEHVTFGSGCQKLSGPHQPWTFILSSVDSSVENAPSDAGTEQIICIKDRQSTRRESRRGNAAASGLLDGSLRWLRRKKRDWTFGPGQSWSKVSRQLKLWLGPWVSGRMGGSTSCHTPVSPNSSHAQKPRYGIWEDTFYIYSI